MRVLSTGGVTTEKSATAGPHGTGVPYLTIGGRNSGGNRTEIQIYSSALAGGYMAIDSFRSGVSGTPLVLNHANNGDVMIRTTVAPIGSGLAVNSGISSSSIQAIEIQQATNGANKAAAAFGITIGNNGESTNAADLTFWTATGGSLVQRMTITTAGAVIVGGTQVVDGEEFKVEGDTHAKILIYSSDDNSARDAILSLHTRSTGAQCRILFTDGAGSGTSPGQIYYNHDGNYMAFYTSASEAMRIFNDGEVTIGYNGTMGVKLGVSTANATLNVADISAINTSYTGTTMLTSVSRNATDTTYYFWKAQRRGYAYSILVDSGGTFTTANNSYGAISDQRLKTDIIDSGSQWDDIKAVRVRKYKMMQDPDSGVHLGVISQELEASGMSGLVQEKDADEYEIAVVDDENILKEGDKTKAVRYSVLYMKAIKALQEAMTRIETLETKVAALEE